MLRNSGIKILVYSGTTDLMVNTYGTWRWIDQLNWPVLKEWRQWNLTSGTFWE